MPSPFPGMDPYIESPNIFSDFYGTLATEIRNALNRMMQPHYVAKIIQRVEYEMIEIEETRVNVPDVSIWEESRLAPTVATTMTLTTTPTAESVVAIEYPARVFSVEIRDVENLRLVTHIEILSPSNKRAGSDSFEKYVSKRRDILRSSAHLVEIDLLRRGTRPRLERPVPVAPYYVTISRSNKRPRVAVWSTQLHEHLPVLPIPLLDPDPDAPLDLGTLIQSVYESGRYTMQIDYRAPPPSPKLSPQEIEYVDSLLKPLRKHA